MDPLSDVMLNIILKHSPSFTHAVSCNDTPIILYNNPRKVALVWETLAWVYKSQVRLDSTYPVYFDITHVATLKVVVCFHALPLKELRSSECSWSINKVTENVSVLYRRQTSHIILEFIAIP